MLRQTIRKEASFIKNSTTFLNIFKQLIADEDIDNLLKKHDYIDVARKFTVSALLHFFTCSSVYEWKSFRHGADLGNCFGLIRSDYSTISKKAKEVPFLIFKDLFALMCSRCNRSIRRQLNFPKELLLVDSTTITVGKTRLLWAPYHGERAGVKLHTALNLSTELPQKVIETTGLKHDSPILDELTDPACIIVADRAYFQIDRSDRFFEENQHFVIRVKTNVEMFRKKNLKRMRDTTSNVINDYTCQVGTKQKRSIHRHRVVEFMDYEGKSIRVVTNLYHVSAEVIANIYKARWGVELFFRWIKQNLNVPRLFGTTKNAVYNQLFAALLVYVVLKFIYTFICKKIKQKPLSLLGFTRQLLYGQLSIEWVGFIQEFCRTSVFV